MSNNIYDILKKIENLEGSRQTLTEGKKAKPDYIDIDRDGDKKEPMKKAAKEKNKGAIAEAVARVEQQLSEKFKGFKKSAAPEIGSNLPKSDIETFGLEPGRGYDINTPSDWKPGDKRRDVRELIPTKDKKDHIRSRLGKHVKPAHLPEGEYNEDMLSPKQKSFAALAEPKNKITYADKIAGAKKGKKDEGNEFSGELVKARAQGKDSFEVDGKSYPVKEDNADFLGGDNPVDHRGHLRLSPAGAKKVYDHPNFDPKLSANAQYDKYFDKGGNPRMSLDQAVEVGKHPEYNPNLPANAQWHLLNKQNSAASMKEGRTSMREGWEEMQKYLEKKRGPESKGGAGKKAGTRYGGSAQKDDDEEMDGEGQPTVKKKGRPKGTGGGAKFSFKKPKD